MSAAPSYVCRRCEVKGIGYTCWFCGRSDAFADAIPALTKNAWAMFADLMARARERTEGHG